MKRKVLSSVFLLLTISIIAVAGQIYDNARQAGINYLNSGKYQLALQQFVAAQNIAPVENDLPQLIAQCNTKRVQQRNSMRTKSKANTNLARTDINALGTKISRYDSIGQYGGAKVALVRYKDKFGFINEDSILVTPIEYDDIYSVIVDAVPGSKSDEIIKASNMKWEWSWDSDQLMSVCKDGKWGYINSGGKIVIPIKYDDVREPIVFKYRELIGVGNNGKYGFVNRTGSEIIPLEYDYVSRFYEGGSSKFKELDYDMVPVVKNGKMGFINDKGEPVIPFEYEPQYDLDYNELVMFRPVWFDGITYVKKNGKFGLINLKGEPVTPFKYDGKADVKLENIGGEWKTYFEFPLNNNKVFYFEGREYNSIIELNQAFTDKKISTSSNNPPNLQIRIIDINEQAKDPDFAKLQLIKKEISKIENTQEIEALHPFSEGVAVIELKNGISLLFKDKEAITIDNIRIHWPHYNSGLLGCCYPRKKINTLRDGFYLDTNGRVAFDNITLPNGNETAIGSSIGKEICGGPFKNGFAEVWHYKGTNAKRGLINTIGKMVVPCKYTSIIPVMNGYVAAKDDDILFLDMQLGVVEKIKNATMTFTSSNEFIIRIYGNEYRRYSGDFTCLEKSKKELYLPTSENRYIIHSGSQFGYCNKEGDIVIPLQYQKAKPFSEDLAAVCINNKYGFIDIHGNMVISTIFDDAGSFHDGIAWVKKNGGFYYIDKTGKLMNNDSYSYAEDFHEGFAIVRRGNKYGVVAKSGLSTFDLI